MSIELAGLENSTELGLDSNAESGLDEVILLLPRCLYPGTRYG